MLFCIFFRDQEEMARLRYENATLRQLLRVADHHTEPGLAKQFANALQESNDTISLQESNSKTLQADTVRNRIFYFFTIFMEKIQIAIKIKLESKLQTEGFFIGFFTIFFFFLCWVTLKHDDSKMLGFSSKLAPSSPLVEDFFRFLGVILPLRHLPLSRP